MSIEISRHELIKDGAGNITGIVIGITFLNEITGKSAYKDRIFSIIDDFVGVIPTKIILGNKVKEWLITKPFIKEVLPDGTIKVIDFPSVLQAMKAETQVQTQWKSFKKGEAGGLVGNIIQEEVI